VTNDYYYDRRCRNVSRLIWDDRIDYQFIIAALSIAFLAMRSNSNALPLHSTLSLLNPGTSLFNTSAPAWRQTRLLS
jgi:hypothetical protein